MSSRELRVQKAAWEILSEVLIPSKLSFQEAKVALLEAQNMLEDIIPGYSSTTIENSQE